MKQQLKKSFSLLVAAILILCAFPFCALQSEAKSEGGFTFTVKNKQVTITGYKTPVSSSLTIPSKLGGYPVTKIGASAFWGFDELTKIKIPDSVESIGHDAFVYCSGLRSVILPKSLKNIGETAFWMCTGIENITLPKRL